MKKEIRLPFLADPALRLILFGGKGGVGKTTCAVATALALARRHPGSRVALVSTDPAHSLRDSLDGTPLPANLEIDEFDAEACLNRFREKNRAKLQEIASRGTFLDEEDISRFLDLSLPGMDEMMGFLDITGRVRDNRCDTLILDTAPTGHTLRLLAMPALIRKWLEAIDTLLAKHRYMKKLFSRVYRRDELDDFIEGLAAEVKDMEALLRDPGRCLFVPVTLAEDLSLQETGRLLASLRDRRIPVTDIVVNGLYPQNACSVCQGGRRRQTAHLADLHALGRPGKWRFWGLPLHAEEVRGAALETFWDAAQPLPAAGNRGKAGEDGTGREEGKEDAEVAAERFLVTDTPLPLPSAFSLLLFAGKGGVGKTTLACAAGVALAEDRAGRKTLLFSTDPAHSLAHCLQVAVGDEPTLVRPGLWAMEMDADAEFAALKQAYRQELQGFLKSILPDMDMTFDREVMERIMDLSPPGLDEIMALTRMVEFLVKGSYDTLILDTAPTGHLIRLLEMPEIVDQWLKVFFGLFLKYRQVFRLPGISQRLVRLSKELKYLRALLKDPGHAALYAVTLPTEMAYAETADLCAACERMQVPVAVLFLNMMTPESDCELCAALRRREALVLAKFAENFSTLRQIAVPRWREPRGVAALAAMGRALYRNSGPDATADRPAAGRRAPLPGRVGRGEERR